MQQSRWERLAPLTGVVAVAIIIAVFSIGGSTPDEHDSASKVWAYYSRHHDKQITLAFILAIALPFLVFFASTLRHELRRAGGTGQLSTAAFGGGVLAAAGFGLLSTVHIALSSAGCPSADETRRTSSTSPGAVTTNSTVTLPWSEGRCFSSRS